MNFVSTLNLLIIISFKIITKTKITFEYVYILNLYPKPFFGDFILV